MQDNLFCLYLYSIIIGQALFNQKKRFKSKKEVTMETAIRNRWYRINEDVEYSTDFDFFTKHQVRVVKSGNKYSFCSRLESKTFKIDNSIFGNNEFSDSQIIEKFKVIHQEILDGKHGQGLLVD